MAARKKRRTGGSPILPLPPGANEVYPSLAKLRKEYQNPLKKNNVLADQEQAWSDKYYQVLADFMGEDRIWEAIIPDVETHGFGGRSSSRSLKEISPVPQAVYSGGHFRSRRAGEEKFFDSYVKGVQYTGTNQFCQTYAMMHLSGVDFDSFGVKRGKWESYYEFTYRALLFIRDVIEKTYEDGVINDVEYIEYLKRADECIRNRYACLNIIEFPKL